MIADSVLPIFLVLPVFAGFMYVGLKWTLAKRAITISSREKWALACIVTASLFPPFFLFRVMEEIGLSPALPMLLWVITVPAAVWCFKRAIGPGGADARMAAGVLWGTVWRGWLAGVALVAVLRLLVLLFRR